jgi:hypothetical protein
MHDPARLSTGAIARLLTSRAKGPGDERFAARNFLLDEHVAAERAAVYEGDVDGADESTWGELHDNYLATHVRWTRGTIPPRTVDSTKSSTPASFRWPVTILAGIAPSATLIRVVTLSSLALAASVPLTEMRAALRDAAVLDDLLAVASRRRDQLPTFVTLWQDVDDLLPEEESDAPIDWADQLRDRLGLTHVRPVGRTPVEIVVFGYPASRLPSAGSPVLRPFTIPTVLDMRPFAAFCPSPEGAATGRIVCLEGTLSSGPRREMLHPPILLTQEDVLRCGNVKRGPSPLPAARKQHLEAIRTTYGRLDYATTTDGDLR